MPRKEGPTGLELIDLIGENYENIQEARGRTIVLEAGQHHTIESINKRQGTMQVSRDYQGRKAIWLLNIKPYLHYWILPKGEK